MFIFNIAFIVAAAATMKLTTTDIAVVKQLLFTDYLPHQEVAERYGVSRRTVRKWSRKYKVFGRPYAPRSVVQGRPKLLTDAQIEVNCIRRRRATAMLTAAVGSVVIP